MHFYFYQIFPSKQLIALAIYYKLNLSIQRISALGRFVTYRISELAPL